MSAGDGMGDFVLPSQLSSQGQGNPRTVPRPSNAGFVQGVTFDRWGRYQLPNGGTGELEPFTRVTTLAGMVTSVEGLRVFTERGIVEGMGLRPDLRQLAASDPSSKEVQDKVRGAAKEAAKLNAAATRGTSRHRLLELHPPGTPWPDHVDPNDEDGQDLAAARSLLTELQVSIQHTELLVANRVSGYAGRLDYLIEVSGQLYILDLKTGAKLLDPGKRTTIGAQLALYGYCDSAFIPGTGWVQAPIINRQVGYVLSVCDGVAALYEVDLEDGWKVARIALALHKARKDSVSFTEVRSLGGGAATYVEQASQFRETLAQASADLLATPDAAEPEVGRKRKRRACSACREVGHFAKNCPTLVDDTDDVNLTPAATLREDEEETAEETAEETEAERTSRLRLLDPCECAPEERTGFIDLDDINGVPRCRTCVGIAHWVMGAWTVEEVAGTVPDVVEVQLRNARSQEELGRIWQVEAAAGRWEDKHTELGKQLREVLPLMDKDVAPRV